MSKRGMIWLGDAAEQLGISMATLYRHLAANGITTFTRVGDRRAYITKEDVATLRDWRPSDRPRGKQNVGEVGG